VNYETVSTFKLLQMLNDCPGDSAEHRAIQKELRRREGEKPKDKQTRILFSLDQWNALARHEK